MIWKHCALALASLAFAGHAAAQNIAEAPQGAATQEQRRVAGLAAPAEIIVDPWGVAHVYAQSERDAFFLQGYNAARDRLWQIDLWRKRGLGRLAESFGEDYAEQDRAARMFLYRGDMDEEWAAYGPNARAQTEAFVAGINAYVAETESGARALPPEFALTGSRPARWRAEDVVRVRSHALTRNLTQEVARARVACAAGLEADRLRRVIEPEWTPTVPEGLDPCVIPESVLIDYERATREVRFSRATQSLQIEGDTRLAELAERAEGMGSNNWVVSPGRTDTGRPLLANDPHRALGVPSLRYIVHLNAPGMSVIGAGEPALPGVSIGHNGAIAFGLTIFAIDQEDLYVYELNPANPLQYRYRGRWENFRQVREIIRVRDGAAQRRTLLFTRHGPVLRFDPSARRAFALRTVWNEPGTSAYFGSARYMSARDWTQFRAAMDEWGAPSENLVFASTAGDIGWVAAGRAPVRRNWDGLLPVPGDGRYEWQGFFAGEDLPSVYNPPQGWFASANEMNLPAGYPIAERRLGFEWSNPTRIRRINAVLGANARVSVRDSMALQMDAHNSDACKLKALLPAGPIANDDARAAVQMLRGWDCVDSTDSAAAALYEVWIARHLGRALVNRVTPQAARAIVGIGSMDAIVAYLETPDTAIGPDPRAGANEVILASLITAMNDARGLLGPDVSRWSWGALHRAHFTPAIAALAPTDIAAQMTVGPLPVRGSGATPAAATYRDDNFQAVAGASYRMVIDVGAWDNSVAVNTPGQSGDPQSPHYRDLFPLWANGDYFPLLYSRQAIEQNARQRITLTPR